MDGNGKSTKVVWASMPFHAMPCHAIEGIEQGLHRTSTNLVNDHFDCCVECLVGGKNGESCDKGRGQREEETVLSRIKRGTKFCASKSKLS